ncbi:hypothetical protein [Synechococcus sp. PCC 7336]|uniref:hypothetical protein n=1 Tax=Synechococcus sp. PCC 7336 TaxID=195250 RepID=UPI0012E9BC36|nr:hypothetical protein [Synechococcus sp. PCC 7336]
MRSFNTIGSVISIFLIYFLFLFSVSASETSELPSQKQIKRACEFVASAEKNTIEDYFLRRGHIDINNDGTAEQILRGLTGTAGGDFFDFIDESGHAISINMVDYEWKSYVTYGQGILPFDGLVYQVHFSDESLKYPQYLTYITPSNQQHILCEFSNTVTEYVSHPSEERSFCWSLLSNSPLQSVGNEFLSSHLEGAVPYPNTLIQVDGTFLSSPNTRIRSETFTTGNKVDVDFNNDGTIDTLVELEFISGAGRGCYVSYFDVLNENQDGFDVSEKHDLLMRIQDIDLEERFPGRCRGNKMQWFRIDELNYLEDKFQGDAPRNKNTEINTIRYLQDGIVHKTCTFGFAINTTVKAE